MSDKQEPANNQQDESLGQVEKPRRIRSFVRRQGRLTDGQQRALDLYWPEHGLTIGDGLLNFSEVFGRKSEVILEIGFGNGSSLVTMAKNQPEKDFVGIEVHGPGVGSLINKAQSEGVKNIRVFHDDAIDVLAACIPKNSLMGFQLKFVFVTQLYLN